MADVFQRARIESNPIEMVHSIRNTLRKSIFIPFFWLHLEMWLFDSLAILVGSYSQRKMMWPFKVDCRKFSELFFQNCYCLPFGVYHFSVSFPSIPAKMDPCCESILQGYKQDICIQVCAFSTSNCNGFVGNEFLLWKNVANVFKCGSFEKNRMVIRIIIDLCE